MKGGLYVLLGEIIEHINVLADEQEPPQEVVGFINDAIAFINADCQANFPYTRLNGGNERLEFDEKWIRTLIIPFAVGRIKQKDSSQFEYTDSYAQIIAKLEDFKSQGIPLEHKELLAGQKVLIPPSESHPSRTHITVSGDTFYRIALAYEVPLQELILLNPMDSFEYLSSSIRTSLFDKPDVIGWWI